MTGSAAAAQRIGFVGTGKMGRPMALRLIEAGFDLACYDADPDRLIPLAAAGAASCRSAAAAAGDAEFVITMLPDGAAVKSVLFGEGGAAGAMASGSLVLDMSSSEPIATRALGRALAKRGISMIDAPVSGGVRKAEEGTLAVMAGGAGDDVARANPVLQALGSRIFHTGALGSGHAVKALNNYVSAAGLAAACEAALVARAFGIDPETLVDVLNASTGRNNTTQVKMKPFILPETFASGFTMALMAKDLNTAADLATEIGHPQSGMAFQAELWSQALQELGPGADHTELYRFLRNVGPEQAA